MIEHEDVERCSICHKAHVGGDAGHAEYAAWCETLQQCRDEYVTAGSDPTATSCDLIAGHSGPHEGVHPLADDWRLSWRGGGYCAGDPLPYSHVRIIEQHPTQQREEA